MPSSLQLLFYSVGRFKVIAEFLCDVSDIQTGA